MSKFKQQLVIVLVAFCIAPLSWGEANFHVKHAWLRSVPPVSQNTAGYFKLCNKGEVGDELVSASSKLAKVVEMHTVVEEDGAFTMKPLSSVPLAAGSCTVFEPGAKHLMFIGLVQPVKEDEVVPVELKLKSGQLLSAEFTVKKGGGEDSSGHQHHHHH